MDHYASEHAIKQAGDQVAPRQERGQCGGHGALQEHHGALQEHHGERFKSIAHRHTRRSARKWRVYASSSRAETSCLPPIPFRLSRWETFPRRSSTIRNTWRWQGRRAIAREAGDRAGEGAGNGDLGNAFSSQGCFFKAIPHRTHPTLHAASDHCTCYCCIFAKVQ